MQRKMEMWSELEGEEKYCSRKTYGVVMLHATFGVPFIWVQVLALPSVHTHDRKLA